MKNLVLLIMIVVVLGGAGVVQAAIFEFPLAGEGEYELLDRWTADIDLGVTFTEITNIYIDWSGEITGGLSAFGENTYTSHGVFSLSLFETDRHVDQFGLTSVSGGFDTYPEPESFDTVQSLTDEGWGAFYDGSATAEIMFHRGPNMGFIVVVPPSGVLDSAKLIVEGTLVPEPTSLLLIACGAFIVRRRIKPR